MKLRIVLFLLAFIFGMQTNWANQEPIHKNGIEPIVADNYLNVPAAEAEHAKVLKKDKKGVGDIITWVKKKLTKVVKKFAQIGDFNDPVDKWFWYWILGWGVAILISIIGSATSLTIYSGFGLLGTLAYLAWVLGTVALVIWIIKQVE